MDRGETLPFPDCYVRLTRIDLRDITRGRKGKSEKIMSTENATDLASNGKIEDEAPSPDGRNSELDDQSSNEENNTKYRCASCTRRFYSHVLYHFHLRDHRLGHPLFQCDFCERKFVSQDKKDRHICAKAKPHKCDQCKKSYVLPLRLRAHQINVHGNKK